MAVDGGVPASCDGASVAARSEVTKVRSCSRRLSGGGQSERAVVTQDRAPALYHFGLHDVVRKVPIDPPPDDAAVKASAEKYATVRPSPPTPPGR